MIQKRNKSFYQSSSTVILLGLLIFSGVLLQSQIIGQDADSYSTIVLPASSLNLDITNNIIVFNYYTYLKENGRIPPFGNDRVVVGGEMKGESKNGISPLFSDEKIVPEASLRFLLGKRIYVPNNTVSKTENLDKLKKCEEVILNKVIQIQSAYAVKLNDLKAEPILDKKIVDELDKVGDGNSNPKDWEKLRVFLVENKLMANKYPSKVKIYGILLARIDSIINYAGNEDDKRSRVKLLNNYINYRVIQEYADTEILDNIAMSSSTFDDDQKWAQTKKIVEDEMNKLNEYNTSLNSVLQGLIDEFVNKNHIDALKEYNEVKVQIRNAENLLKFMNSHLFYFRGGFNGSEFKYDLKNNLDSIENRIIDKKFNGWDAEIGLTSQIKSNHLFGLSLKASYSNNFSFGLEETEYSFTKVDATITEGSFSTTEKVKAYSGDYDTFMKYSVNFDYVSVFPINNQNGENTNLYLTLNPYLRHQFYDGSMNLKNNTIVGVGFNAFNSEKQKIMGGLFIQTNDMFGVHSKNGVSLGERISFGLVAKFSFAGIELKEKV